MEVVKMNYEKRMEDIIDRIKNRRNELMMSYQDLADKTGLSKSTLQRYETGSIKNMPIDKLGILANALNVNPVWLMGYDVEKFLETENKITNLSKEETKLLENFNKLNDLGKKEANKRVAELTEINKYIDDDTTNELCSTLNSSQNYIIKMPKESKRERLQDYFTTIAAHNDDLTEEEKIIAEQKVLEALRKAKLI